MDIREKIKERMPEKVIRSKFLKKLYFSFCKIVLFFLAIIHKPSLQSSVLSLIRYI